MSEKQRIPVAVENLRRIWELKKSEMQITQAQAAKKLGWTQGAFSQYLNNITTLNPAAVIKLANFLGVDPIEIDPDINNHLPSIQKTEVRYLASDSSTRLRNFVVYGDVSLQFFTVIMDQPIAGVPDVPLNSLILCTPSDKEPLTRSTTIAEKRYLVCRKDGSSFECVTESQCPPKFRLKSKWLIHGFLIH